MSTSPESGSPELGLDLDLHFLPAWAQKPAQNQYASFEGGEQGFDRRRGDRGERRDRRNDRPPRREGAGQPRPGGRPDRPGGPANRGGGRPRFQDRDRRPERAEPMPPPLEVDIAFIPDEKGVESLARQIRLTGRAYPLFDVAFLILKKPDRYNVRFGVIKKPDGQVAQPLFICALDDTLWTSEQEAVDYVLGKHFTTFYQPERTPTEPPKGTYTFVAQCGMSGTILGPPNYHDYQNKLRKLHAERFSRMPFEAFKARIKIVRDEAVVKKWLEDQSWKTEYVCLNLPESLKLSAREQVEEHFRQTHLPNVIKPVESHTLTGTAAQALPNHALQRAVRRAWDDQMHFPLRMVNVLSQQFASHGLQFFKVNKAVTHVAVARPRYLDLELTPVSEGVQRIVEFIQATHNCTRRKILEALAPIPAVAPAPAPAPAPEPPPAGTEAPAAAAPAAPPTENATSPEMAAVISDLHWLIHQGHVIEFAKGTIELARKPLPRPPKPERKQPTTPAVTDDGQGAVESHEAAQSPGAAAEAGVEAEAAAGAGQPAESPHPAVSEAGSSPAAAPEPQPPETETSGHQPTQASLADVGVPEAPTEVRPPTPEGTPAS